MRFQIGQEILARMLHQWYDQFQDFGNAAYEFHDIRQVAFDIQIGFECHGVLDEQQRTHFGQQVQRCYTVEHFLVVGALELDNGVDQAVGQLLAGFDHFLGWFAFGGVRCGYVFIFFGCEYLDVVIRIY